MARALHTDSTGSDFQGFSFASRSWSLSEALSVVCSILFDSATSTERSIGSYGEYTLDNQGKCFRGIETINFTGRKLTDQKLLPSMNKIRTIS